MFEKRKCKKVLKGQISRLKELEKILERYSNLPKEPREILITLVGFFNEISKFQDEGSFKVSNKMEKFFPEAYSYIQTINAHISNAGRCRNGWNRTSIGQEVTIDDVYLGGIFGIWTFTVRHWLYNVPEDHTHLDIVDKSTNKKIWLTKLVSDFQAKAFMKDHVSIKNDVQEVLNISARL
ncbi:MAG: hypothetical protein PHR25_04995 [Clostridia bacterium]|nr:hypothetical protein [Clostridia bacterium]MDD4376121.1 hypothetical protein [Clostridia bacterium]